MTNQTEPTFDWSIDESRTWPPLTRPRPPFGPTGIEVIRSCPLRSCFERSSGYACRLGFSARVGTAFHRTIQSLHESPISANSIADFVDLACRRFDEELRAQLTEADTRLRERLLPRDPVRADQAREAIIVAARHLAEAQIHAFRAEGNASKLPERMQDDALPTSRVEVEIPVATTQGLLRGVVDRAEHYRDGVHLFDFKSARRDDLPERYERQMQLYALMWHDTRGEWPVSAEVIYPLMDRSYQVSVTPEECERVGRESENLARRLMHEKVPERLAQPGEVCQVCEFRPWCQPFWKWQERASNLTSALQLGYWGFEGAILGIEIVENHWRVIIRWRSAEIELVAPLERFPQLRMASVGSRIRALEVRLRGIPTRPRAMVTDRSEIFVLSEPPRTLAASR